MKILYSTIMMFAMIIASLMFYSCSGNDEDYSLESLAKVLSNYDNVGDFHDGLAMVVKDGKVGYINKYGEEIVPCKYDDSGVTNFSEGFATVRKDAYWGFIDKSGKEITKMIYSSANDFKDGFALVEKAGKKGYIDNTGKEVISPIYDYAKDFSENLAAVCKNEKWGYIDKTGKEVIPLKYSIAEDFTEGLAAVGDNGKCGYIDNTGKTIIPFQYIGAEPFSEGIAQVSDEENFYIDKTGKRISKGYWVTEPFQGGIAIVGRDAKSGFIDKTGNEILPCKYRIVKQISDELIVIFDEGGNFCVDKKGNKIFDYKYDEGGYTNKYEEGFYIVIKEERYGFIDINGKELTQCVYDEAHPFSEGLALVKKNGSYGYVDKKGKSTFDFQQNDSNSEEVIKKRLNEIGEFALNNDEGVAIEKYFSEEFKKLYKQMKDYASKYPDLDGPWYSGDFWSGSSEDSPSTMTAGNIHEINGNKAVADLIMGDGNQKHAESVSLVLENGNWFIDDIRGHKKELKEVNEGWEEEIKNLPKNTDWLQGHWVYEQGNYKGHFIIQGDKLIQYSSMNKDRYEGTFRVEDGEIRARLIDGMDLVAKIDFANQRIDYGDGQWMHKISSDAGEDYSSSTNSSGSRQRPFSDGEDVMARLYNQKFRHSSGLEIIVDGYGRIEIDGDPAGILSVLRYNSESALLRYGNGLYGEGKLLVKIEGNRLVLQDTADGSVFYQKR